jgi:hypothetical protein
MLRKKSKLFSVIVGCLDPKCSYRRLICTICFLPSTFNGKLGTNSLIEQHESSSQLITKPAIDENPGQFHLPPILSVESEVAQSVYGLGYGLGDRDSIPDRGNERKPDPIQTPIHQLPEALWPVARRPGRQAYHSLPSSIVKNAWRCNSPHTYFVAWSHN